MKKQRVKGREGNGVLAAGNDFVTSVDELADVLAIIFSFFRFNEIMLLRCVNKQWREAAKQTIVPSVPWTPFLKPFCVDSVEKYNGVSVMSTALPNLQQLYFYCPGRGHKYSDGEDPDEEQAAESADRTSHDIEIISSFSKLRELTIWNSYRGARGLSSRKRVDRIDYAILNGRYPVLFNSFPLLQKLSINKCAYLKWDLDMLAGMPLLKELDCWSNNCLTGNIASLRVLKNTLEKVKISTCSRIEGNFMDLADFPHLNELDLDKTAVTGDIRDIGENDFSSLEHESLTLPKGVYCGRGYEFERISDAPQLVSTIYQVNTQLQGKLKLVHWCLNLSDDSPDWYPSRAIFNDTPPFCVRFQPWHPLRGYRWETANCNPCLVNWLNQENIIELNDYGRAYAEDLINERVKLYDGFYQPPTRGQYNRLREVQDEDEYYYM